MSEARTMAARSAQRAASAPSLSAPMSEEPVPATADLAAVMGELYAEEVNCSVASFWDAGWIVKFGNDMNGIKAEATFRPEES